MQYIEFLKSFNNPHSHLTLKNQIIELYFSNQKETKLIALNLFREAVIDNNFHAIIFLIRECQIRPNDSIDQFGNKILFLVNDAVTAQLLMSNGADINQNGILNQIPLHVAQNASIAKELYDKDKSLNKQDIIGDTPLHVAAEEGRLDVVKFLLQNGSDVQILNKKGQTALHKTSDPKIVEVLVKAGIDINSLDGNNRSILHIPKNSKLSEYLLNNGADINKQDVEGKTALHYSVEKFTKHKISRLLLESDADIYIKDNKEQTALHKVKDSEVAKFLFSLYPELKGKIDDKDQTGHTPLQYAIDHGKKSLASLYIQAGANAMQTGDNGKTLLHLAHNVAMVDLLIKKGVNANITDENGKTALYDMLYEGNSEAANILIESITNNNKTESNRDEKEILSKEDKDNLLLNAVKNGYLSTAKLLMQQNADVFQTMEDGISLAYFALRNGNIEIAKMLADNNLELSQAEKDQLVLETINTQNTDTLKYLIAIGGNINQLTEQGHNFLYKAVNGNQIKLVEFFLQETGLQLSEEDKDELALNAINNGLGQQLDLMIKQKIIDANYIDTKSGSCILEIAALKGDKVLVDYLLSKEAKTELLDKNKILSHSVINKNNLIIKWVVDLGGVDLDKALEDAIVSSNIRAVKLLLDVGANGAQLDANGNNLFTKVTNGPIGNLLLKKHPELAQQQDLSGNSMIKNAILTNRINIVDIMSHAQDNNPAKTISQEELDELLIISIEKDHNKSVKWLIDNGAHVNQDNNNPLHVAAKSGNQGAAKLLFNKYADVAKKDQYGKFAVDYSKDNAISNLFAYHMMKIVIDDAYYQRNKDITLDVAIRYLKDPNLKLEDNSGHTLLTYAIYKVTSNPLIRNNEKQYFNTLTNIVTSLINKGADIHLSNNDNKTPMYYAIYKNSYYYDEERVTLVKTLINYGALIAEEYKQTLLDSLFTYLYPAYAHAIPYCLKVADILYHSGALIEEVDIYKGSQSTLHVDIVKWLINKGKKVDIDTLFDVSRTNNKEAMQLLYNNGIR